MALKFDFIKMYIKDAPGTGNLYLGKLFTGNNNITYIDAGIQDKEEIIYTILDDDGTHESGIGIFHLSENMIERKTVTRSSKKENDGSEGKIFVTSNSTVSTTYKKDDTINPVPGGNNWSDYVETIHADEFPNFKSAIDDLKSKNNIRLLLKGGKTYYYSDGAIENLPNNFCIESDTNIPATIDFSNNVSWQNRGLINICGSILTSTRANLIGNMIADNPKIQISSGSAVGNVCTIRFNVNHNFSNGDLVFIRSGSSMTEGQTAYCTERSSDEGQSLDKPVAVTVVSSNTISYTAYSAIPDPVLTIFPLVYLQDQFVPLSNTSNFQRGDLVQLVCDDTYSGYNGSQVLFMGELNKIYFIIPNEGLFLEHPVEFDFKASSNSRIMKVESKSPVLRNITIKGKGYNPTKPTYTYSDIGLHEYLTENAFYENVTYIDCDFVSHRTWSTYFSTLLRCTSIKDGRDDAGRITGKIETNYGFSYGNMNRGYRNIDCVARGGRHGFDEYANDSFPGMTIDATFIRPVAINQWSSSIDTHDMYKRLFIIDPYVVGSWAAIQVRNGGATIENLVCKNIAFAAFRAYGKVTDISLSIKYAENVGTYLAHFTPASDSPDMKNINVPYVNGKNLQFGLRIDIPNNMTGSFIFGDIITRNCYYYSLYVTTGTTNSLLNIIGDTVTGLEHNGSSIVYLNNTQDSYIDSVYGEASKDIWLVRFDGVNQARNTIGNVKGTTSSGTVYPYLISNGIHPDAPIVKNSNFTLENLDKTIINAKSSSACIVTLPISNYYQGRTIRFVNQVNQYLNASTSIVVPLIGGSVTPTILPNIQGSWADLTSNGTNWRITAEGGISNVNPISSNTEISNTSFVAMEGASLIKIDTKRFIKTKSLIELGAKNNMNNTEISLLNQNIQNAFNAGFRRFDGLDETYSITGNTGLIFPPGSEFYNAKIDASNQGNNGNNAIALQCSGSQGSPTSLTSNTNTGDYIITVANTAVFSENQLVFIKRDRLFHSFAAAPISELNRVRKIIDGTTIWLYYPVTFDFPTTDNSTIAPILTNRNLSYFHDLELVGKNVDNFNQKGMTFRYLDGIQIERINSYEFDSQHANFFRCLHARGIRNSFRKSIGYLAYGYICEGGTRDMQISGGDAAHMRHGSTTGSGSAGGIQIDISVDGLHCYNMADAGIDFHGTTIGCYVNNCTVHGDNGQRDIESIPGVFDGIVSQGVNTRITNSIVKNGVGSGIKLQPLSDMNDFFGGGYATADNCYVENCGYDGIVIYMDSNNTKLDKVSITNSVVRDCSYIGGSSCGNFRVLCSTGTRINDLSIINNRSYNSAGFGFYLRGNGGIFDQVYIENQNCIDSAFSDIYCYIDGGNVDNLNINYGKLDGSLSTSAQLSILASISGSIKNLNVSNMKLINSIRGMYIRSINANSLIDIATIKNNYVRTPNNENILVQSTTNGIFNKVIFEGNDTDGGTYGIRSLGVITVTSDGTNHLGTHSIAKRSLTTANNLFVVPDYGMQKIVTITANNTIEDGIETIINNKSSNNFLTFPSASIFSGRKIHIVNNQQYTVDSASNNIISIEGNGPQRNILPAIKGSWVDIISDGNNWIIIASQ